MPDTSNPSPAAARDGPSPGTVLPWWTWVLPFLIFHFGTGLSLSFQISKGMSLWYFPVPLGMILIQWWGPRILIGLFLNAMLCAGYWGLYHWWFWPLYALPETIKVGLSWWLFARLSEGKCWLPDLRNTWRYLILGVLLPSFVTSFYGNAQLVLLGDAGTADFLRNAYAEFVLDLLSPFALTVPVLLFTTSYLERYGLTITRGAYPRPPLILSRRFQRSMLLEAAAVFAALLVLSFFVSLERNWFVYGIFLIWAALRFGIGLAAVGTVWTIFIALPLPALLSNHFAVSWLSRSELARVNLNLATLCFAALIVGRALSDVYQEIESRIEVERTLRKSNAERIEADEALIASESKYRSLFASASDAIVLGENMIFTDCNDRALEMFGATREQFIGAPAARFFPAVLEDGRDATGKLQEYREAALNGKPQIFEWRMNRLDGSLFETEITFAGITLEGRTLIMAVVRDVTKRKAMEKALSDNEAKYRTLFESANDAVLLTENRIIVDCNQRSTELFRYKREELIGLNAELLFPEYQGDGVASAVRLKEIQAMAVPGTPLNFQWDHKRSDGTVFETESIRNVVSIDGRRMVLVVIRDLSERRRIEMALIESEERFRQMAENIQEIFFLLDRNTRTMLYMSPVAESILGVPLHEILNKPFRIADFLPVEDRDRIGFLENGAWYTKPFNEDFRFVRPDRGVRWLRLRSFLIRDAHGEVYRIAGVVSDITEYKNAQVEAQSHQQRLIQADKMNSLGMMVSGVAHEINNPNNLIMLNSDVLETFWRHMRPVLRDHVERNPDWKLAGIPYGSAEGKYDTLLSGVTGGSKRIKRIVDNLKDFARMDEGDLTESVALDKVIEASVGIVDNLIRKSTDRFSVNHGTDLPRIRGNFQKLEQVVINLITNACQALDGRGKAIRISTWHESDRGMVGIRVEDEGKGIPAGLLDKVADPFFTTKRDAGGTGLGLSVSYGIVREHRGIIEFKSEENQGTTVEIRIPVQPEKT